MPLYVYAEVLENGGTGTPFEVLQSISDEPLTTHPETGRPVRRLLTAPKISKPWSSKDTATKLDNKNLEKMGFTKYVKNGKGGYEKTCGDGPDLIKK